MTWELVVRHHEEQKLIARNAVARLSPLWNIIDFNDLRGSTPDWLLATKPVVEQAYLTSRYVATEFVKSYRREMFPQADPLDIELPNPLGLFTPERVPTEIGRAITASMIVTGPVHIARLMPMDETEALRAGFSKNVGAATRLILNGGRGMVRLLADVDQLATGVAAVSDDSACDSCKFINTPILKSEGSRRMSAVAVGHDFCKCSARLVY